MSELKLSDILSVSPASRKMTLTEPPKVEEAPEPDAPERPAYEDPESISAFREGAKSGLSGITKGLTGIFGFGGDVSELASIPTRAGLERLQAMPAEEKEKYKDLQVMGVSAQDLFKAEPKIDPLLPTSEEVFSGIGKVAKPVEEFIRYQPKTEESRMIKTAGEFLGGSPTKKARTIMGLLGLGGTVGALEEAGMEEAALATALLAPSVGTAMKSGMTDLEKFVDQVPTQDLTKAREMQQKAQELGMPLTPFEAIGGRGTAVAEGLQNYPEVASELYGLLDVRQQKMPEVTEQVKDIIANVVDDPDALSKGVTQEIKDAVSYNYKLKSKIAGEAGYDAAKLDIVPAETLKQVYQRLEKAKGIANSPEEADVLKRAMMVLGTAEKGKKQNVVFADKSAESLDKALGIMKDVKDKSFALRKAIDLIDESVLSTNKNIVAGRKADMQARENLIKVIPDTMLQKIEKQNNVTATDIDMSMRGPTATPNSINRIANILNQPSTKKISGEKTTVGQPEFVDGDVKPTKQSLFPEVARFTFKQAIDANAQKGLSSGSDFVKSIRGQSGTSLNKNYNAIVDNVARSKGLNQSETASFKKGLDDVLDVLERTGSVDGFSKLPTATRELDPRFSMRLATNEFNRAISFLELIRLRKSVNNQKALAKVITSDDGISELIKIGRQARDVRRNISGLRTLIIAARETEESNGLLGEE